MRIKTTCFVSVFIYIFLLGAVLSDEGCSLVLDGSSRLYIDRFVEGGGLFTHSIHVNPQQITFEAWIYPDVEFYNPSGVILQSGIIWSESPASFVIRYDSLSNTVVAEVWSFQNENWFMSTVTPIVTISPGMWNHIAFDTSLQAFYINGAVVINTVSSRIMQTDRPSRLFAIGTNFTGGIDEVRVWNKSQSQAEVQYGMKNFCPSSVVDYLLLYLSFDDCGGNVTVDMSQSQACGRIGPNTMPNWGRSHWGKHGESHRTGEKGDEGRRPHQRHERHQARMGMLDPTQKRPVPFWLSAVESDAPHIFDTKRGEGSHHAPGQWRQHHNGDGNKDGNRDGNREQHKDEHKGKPSDCGSRFNKPIMFGAPSPATKAECPSYVLQSAATQCPYRTREHGHGHGHHSHSDSSSSDDSYSSSDSESESSSDSYSYSSDSISESSESGDVFAFNIFWMIGVAIVVFSCVRCCRRARQRRACRRAQYQLLNNGTQEFEGYPGAFSSPATQAVDVEQQQQQQFEQPTPQQQQQYMQQQQQYMQQQQQYMQQFPPGMAHPMMHPYYMYYMPQMQLPQPVFYAPNQPTNQEQQQQQQQQ